MIWCKTGDSVSDSLARFAGEDHGEVFWSGVLDRTRHGERSGSAIFKGMEESSMPVQRRPTHRVCVSRRHFRRYRYNENT
jgi:hypothetical protein